ncbi:MAG: ABC transporter ATP-binding protein [Myxococcota bacterium]
MATARVSLRGIVKRFGPITANDGVDFELDGGEIVALIGENGAGKTTLMNVLYGLVQPDAGEIRLSGETTRVTSPQAAIAAGLGMVHQHFMLFPSLTVAENVVFAAEPRRWGLCDTRAAEAEVAALAERYQLAVDPAAPVGTLPVGVRQRVEILKLLYRSAEVLILDEPTAVLTPGERVALFAVLDTLRQQGKGIVLITHKLDEAMAVCDRAVVMRGGRVVAESATAETSADELAAAMVGRALAASERLSRGDRAAEPSAPALLELTDIHVDGRGGDAVRGVDLTVRAGEIIGLAGVAGNGQSALVEAVVGLRPAARGRIAVADNDVTAGDVVARRSAGLAYIPDDRQRVGLAVAASVHDNVIMGHHRARTRRGWLDRRGLRALARRLLGRLSISVHDLELPASALSGGNQQRLVAARELSRGAVVILAEQPTRGVDIAASAAIHDQLRQHRDGGKAVLLVSADLAELLALSDRILIMYEGRIAGEVTASSADEGEIGRLMAGRGSP